MEVYPQEIIYLFRSRAVVTRRWTKSSRLRERVPRGECERGFWRRPEKLAAFLCPRTTAARWNVNKDLMEIKSSLRRLQLALDTLTFGSSQPRNTHRFLTLTFMAKTHRKSTVATSRASLSSLLRQLSPTCYVSKKLKQSTSLLTKQQNTTH